MSFKTKLFQVMTIQEVPFCTTCDAELVLQGQGTPSLSGEPTFRYKCSGTCAETTQIEQSKIGMRYMRLTPDLETKEALLQQAQNEADNGTGDGSPQQ